MTKVHCIDFDFIMILHIWSETDRINWQTSGQMIMMMFMLTNRQGKCLCNSPSIQTPDWWHTWDQCQYNIEQWWHSWALAKLPHHIIITI